MIENIEQLEKEYALTAGKSLNQYLATSRIGMTFKMTRQERIDFYNSIEWAEHAPDWKEHIEKLKIKYLGHKCPKCNGHGWLQQYQYNQGGVCFTCGGKGRIK